MKAYVDFIKKRNGNTVVQCVVEIPEKDKITNNDFRIFKEDMTLIYTKNLSKWNIYTEKAKIINILFDRICQNIERFGLYGIK